MMYSQREKRLAKTECANHQAHDGCLFANQNCVVVKETDTLCKYFNNCVQPLLLLPNYK